MYKGLPEIYGQLEEGVQGLSALVSVHSAICETSVSVVVFHRPMVNWRRGWGLCTGMCGFCYRWVLLKPDFLGA